MALGTILKAIGKLAMVFFLITAIGAVGYAQLNGGVSQLDVNSEKGPQETPGITPPTISDNPTVSTNTGEVITNTVDAGDSPTGTNTGETPYKEDPSSKTTLTPGTRTPTESTSPTPTPTLTPTPTPTPTDELSERERVNRFDSRLGTDPDDPGRSYAETNLGTVNTTEVEALTLKKINKYRRSKGLDTFIHSTALASTSRAHSFDMYDRSYFAHENLDGEGPYDRWFRDDWRYCKGYGENIVQTYLDTPVDGPYGDTVEFETEEELAQSLLQYWQESPPHDRLLREEAGDSAGMGVYIEEASGGSGYIVYATLNVCYMRD